MGISAKSNANSFIQDLNSIHRGHSQDDDRYTTSKNTLTVSLAEVKNPQ